MQSVHGDKMSAVGDFGYVIEQLLNYLKDKGQIWSAAQLASIRAVGEIIKKKYGVDLLLDKFVEWWLSYSVVEASRWTTVAQRNVEHVAKISTTINYVEEQASRTKFLPFNRSKKKE
jgi:hypothetical protein